MKQVVRADEQVYSGYFIGVNTREGSATCENGETATVNSYAVWDQIWHKECFKEGYTIFTFKDFSKMIMKNKLTQIPDPKGEAEWIWDGTAEIIKGTIQFNGIKGSGSFKGKQLFPDKKSINEWTITFTLPPK